MLKKRLKPRQLPEETGSLFLSGLVNPALVVNALQDPHYFTRLLDPPIMSLAIRSLRNRLTDIRKCVGKKPVTIVVMPSFGCLRFGYAIWKEIRIYGRSTPFDVRFRHTIKKRSR